MRMRRSRVTLFALPLAAGVIIHAQSQQRPRFRSDLQVVEVDVTVLDRQGRAVTGLTRDDFEVFEDGAPVEISAFDAVTLPESPPPSWISAAPDTSGAVRASNERALEGRIVVLFVDDRGFSFNAGRFQRLKRSVRAFLDRLGPLDQVALMATTGARELQVEFTTDRQRIWKAFDVPPIGISNTGEKTLEVLARVARDLEPVSRRRKVIAFFSEGGSLGITRSMVVGSSEENMVPYLQEFLDSARRANVVLYSFDVRPPGSLDEMIEHETLDHAAGARAGASDASSDLYTVAEATGGEAAVSTNFLAEAVGRMFEQTRSYYLIGYARPAAGDGKFHAIQVRTRTGDYVVRARAGFVDEKPARGETAPAPRVEHVAAAPIQTHGLEIRTVAVTMPSAEAGVLVMTEINGAQLTGVGTLAVTTLAVDMSGKVRASDRYSASVSAAPGADARWARIASSLALRPGRYQLRVAVASNDDGVSGSMFSEIEVPRFKGPLAVGGLVLGVTGTRGVARADRLPPHLEVVPMASSEVTGEMEVRAAVPVRLSGSGQAVDVAWHLVDPSGTARELERRRIAGAELRGGLGSITVALPLKDVEPGVYRVGIALSTGRGTPVRRELQFQVVSGADPTRR